MRAVQLLGGQHCNHGRHSGNLPAGTVKGEEVVVVVNADEVVANGDEAGAKGSVPPNTLVVGYVGCAG